MALAAHKVCAILLHNASILRVNPHTTEDTTVFIVWSQIMFQRKKNLNGEKRLAKETLPNANNGGLWEAGQWMELFSL